MGRRKGKELRATGWMGVSDGVMEAEAGKKVRWSMWSVVLPHR